MPHDPSELDRPLERRTLLLAAAGLVVGQRASSASAPATTAPSTAIVADAPTAPPPGKPGEFDFLAGSWKIHHRRLKVEGGNDWDEFPGEATCWTILGGVGSIEELRIPARNFAGLGLRLLDVENRVWNDFWVNARSGVLSTPGQTGGFRDGVGTFGADDVDGDQPIKVRGVWDRITQTSCRWHQAISRDGGRTWVPNWFMDWTRA